MHIHGRMLVIRVTLDDDTCWRWGVVVTIQV